jgi:hypothetical protein
MSGAESPEIVTIDHESLTLPRSIGGPRAAASKRALRAA